MAEIIERRGRMGTERPAQCALETKPRSSYLLSIIKSRADALANLPDPGKVVPRKRDVA